VKQIYGISRITLINWEAKGALKSYRTIGGQRRYKKEDMERALGLEKEIFHPKVAIYSRVSTNKQEEYLKNQLERLKSYCREKNY